MRCRSGEFYTGYTRDPAHRIRLHNAGLASKFTRSRRPVELVYLEKCRSRSAALVREAQVKRLKRREKMLLCERFGRSKKLGQDS